MKKCFTINPMRTREEFISYMKLLDDKLYQAIEIFYPYNQSNAQIEQYTSSVNEIKKLYPNVEMVLHLPHSIYNGLCLDKHLNAGSLEIMKAGAKYASSFGIKKLTLHLGQVDKNVDRSYFVKKIIPIVRDLCDYAKNFDQYVMIENMPADSELGYSPSELLEIIEGINRPNIKFIFDTGHAHVSCYDDQSYLYLLKDYLYHIHYSDNDGSRDAHARMGSGTIDFDKHFKALKDINYNELHCMEVIYKNDEDLRAYASDFVKWEKKYEI